MKQPIKKHLIFLALLICSHLFAEYSRGKIEQRRKPKYYFSMNKDPRQLKQDQARVKTLNYERYD